MSATVLLVQPSANQLGALHVTLAKRMGEEGFGASDTLSNIRPTTSYCVSMEVQSVWCGVRAEFITVLGNNASGSVWVAHEPYTVKLKV